MGLSPESSRGKRRADSFLFHTACYCDWFRFKTTGYDGQITAAMEGSLNTTWPELFKRNTEEYGEEVYVDLSPHSWAISAHNPDQQNFITTPLDRCGKTPHAIITLGKCYQAYIYACYEYLSESECVHYQHELMRITGSQALPFLGPSVVRLPGTKCFTCYGTTEEVTVEYADG